MKIALLPSTQWTSIGNGIGSHVEAELCQDVAARLLPKLRAAGHTVEIFAGKSDANTDGAVSCVQWGANIAASIHLDSADGTPAALLCFQEARSYAMGSTILATYCREMGIKNKGGMIRTPGTNGVAVIRIPEAANIPAALIECGDMNNPDGPNWTDPNHREKAANALAVAICAVAGGATPQPKPKEDDMQSWDYYNVNKVSKIDCYRDKCNYYVATDGATKNLVFTFQAKDSIDPISSASQDIKTNIQHDHNMQTILAQPKFANLKGSYKLTVTCSDKINIGIREVPKQ